MSEQRITELESMIQSLLSDVASLSYQVTQGIESARQLAAFPDFSTDTASDYEEPFKLQFFPETDITIAGVPQVRVWQGYHLTPSGRYHWPYSGDGELVPITGTGWIITRQPKSGPGAVDVVFQATGANPSSTTHYESDVCRVDYSGGDIYLHELSPGERNFVATI